MRAKGFCTFSTIIMACRQIEHWGRNSRSGQIKFFGKTTSDTTTKSPYDSQFLNFHFGTPSFLIYTRLSQDDAVTNDQETGYFKKDSTFYICILYTFIISRRGGFKQWVGMGGEMGGGVAEVEVKYPRLSHGEPRVIHVLEPISSSQHR